MILACLMRILSLFLFISLVIGINSCATGSHQTMPEENSTELKLLKKKCTTCHGLPHPKRHTSEQWKHLLMFMKEIMTERGVSYSEKELRQIQSYLQRNAR
jgi:hypothetical protein